MSRLLFISSESLYTTSDELILKITNPIEEKFNDMYTTEIEKGTAIPKYGWILWLKKNEHSF